MRTRSALAVVPPLLMLTLMMSATVGFAFSNGKPQRGEAVLLVTPPWISAAKTTALSDGIVLRGGRLGLFALAYSPDADFFSRLRRHGAIGVLSGNLSKFLCT